MPVALSFTVETDATVMTLAVGLLLVVHASETSHVSVFSHDFKSLE